MLAAIAYTETGFFAGHNVCCWAYAGAAAWLPLMLLGAERAIRATSWRNQARWWGIGGLAMSQILAAWIGQASYYALLVLGSFVVYRTLLSPPPHIAGTKTRLKALVLNGAGLLVFGTSLVAAGLLPRLEYNLLSNLPGGYPDTVSSAAAWTDWGVIE